MWPPPPPLRVHILKRSETSGFTADLAGVAYPVCGIHAVCSEENTRRGKKDKKIKPKPKTSHTPLILYPFYSFKSRFQLDKQEGCAMNIHGFYVHSVFQVCSCSLLFNIKKFHSFPPGFLSGFAGQLEFIVIPRNRNNMTRPSLHCIKAEFVGILEMAGSVAPVMAMVCKLAWLLDRLIG